MIHGSSRISNLTGISSITGPTGPRGPASGVTGAIGNTGEIGPVGFTGAGITWAIGTGGDYRNEIIFTITGYEGGTYGGVISSGTTLGVTAVRGGTGEKTSDDFYLYNTIGKSSHALIQGEDGDNYGELFKEKIGITAYFRNLSFSGRDIGVSDSEYAIYISGSTANYGRMGNTGELLFINAELGGLSAHGALNTFWSGSQLTARILNHREFFDGVDNNNNLPAKYTDPTNTSTVTSTSNIDGTAVTFSSIFTPEDGSPDWPDDSTSIASGIHVGTDGADTTVYRFPGVTFSSQYTLDAGTLGSCCFCAVGDGTTHIRECVDYASKIYCQTVGGNFSTDSCANRYDSQDSNCFVSGACCVNGICTHSSNEKCVSYGGFFVGGWSCDEIAALAGNDSNPTGCPFPCESVDRGSCCINKECFPYSEYECSFYDGIWTDKPCEETNCCLEYDKGACCVDRTCYYTTPKICSQLRSQQGDPGIFWGVGSNCAGLNLLQDDDTIDESYAPYNCMIWNGFEYVTTGTLNTDGTCADGSGWPPCGQCTGWKQLMPADDVVCSEPGGECLCDGVQCECAPDGVQSYTCNGGICGTMVLSDNTCWECCRTQSEEGEVGACCLIDEYGENFFCERLKQSTCIERNGYWNDGDCNISCNYGACCSSSGGADSCTSGKNPKECEDDAGTWYPGDCNSVVCSTELNSRGTEESTTPLPFGVGSIPPSGNVQGRNGVVVGSKNTSNTDRKPNDIPNPTIECSGKFNLSETINPSIVIPPTNNKDSWIIEVGSGDCSCCCPGICWQGALGDGGIVNDCSEINKLCYPIYGSISSQCASGGSYDSNSLPTNKPINPKSDVFIPNKNGCVPYLDESDPKNPIWMTCACCCTDKPCIEYDEPQLPYVCEQDSNCKCVNGIDNCFLP